eukprot:COSAG04_NODE_31443_length_256_cov_2.267516_1_plen_45_part_10
MRGLNQIAPRHRIGPIYGRAVRASVGQEGPVWCSLLLLRGGKVSS